MERFEYKKVTSKLSEAQLNILGENGWEMVSYNVIKYDNLWSSENTEYYMFKRKIND